MPKTLIIVARGRKMGTLRQKAAGTYFEYDPEWQSSDEFPLSLSMPLAGDQYSPAVVEPFLKNLLPDNEQTLAAWSKEFHTSTGAFALLRHKGEECPGAIQIVSEERALELLGGEMGGFTPLSEEDVAQLLRNAKDAAQTGRSREDSGQFSLAGAQPKIALALKDSGWTRPYGRHPTTHIIKPTWSTDELELNELFCMQLAGALGLRVAQTEFARFGQEQAIVVARYDRVEWDGRVRRVHQEDLCQALRVAPYIKYQYDGGPSAQDITELLRVSSSEPDADVERFNQALLYNYFIVGTDAHAKNYSLLHGRRGRVRLSPFYDIASYIPNWDPKRRTARFAMKIGSNYSIKEVHREDWKKQWLAMRLDPDEGAEQLRAMREAIPDLASTVALRLSKKLGPQAIFDVLVDGIAARAASL